MGKKTKKKFWTMPKTRKFKSFKKRQDNEYYLTEVRLNKEIKEFREMFNSLSYPLSVDEYDDMDSRRLKLSFYFLNRRKKSGINPIIAAAFIWNSYLFLSMFMLNGNI